MGQSVTITPVLIFAFHPVHKLQTLTLVIVTCRKLDGEGVLVMFQLQAIGLVECLCQYHAILILVASQDFLLADKELCQHHTG